MISKIGESLVKHGFLIGAWRAANLNKQEEDALKREYGLSPNSSLVLRNMGRDVVGGMLGAMPGNILARYGIVTGSSKALNATLPVAWGGNILGSILASSKYSRGNAEEIMRKKKKAAQ